MPSHDLQRELKCILLEKWREGYEVEEWRVAGEETEQKLIRVFHRNRNSPSNTHAHTHHYQRYCEEILLTELLLKCSRALMLRTGQGKAVCV